MRRGWLLLVVLSLMLAGCGSGPPVRLFPPELSLAELRYDDQGAVAVLRLRSFSTVPVRVKRVSGHLELGPAGLRVPVALQPDLLVAATSVELLEVAFNPDAEQRALLESTTANRRALDYRIEAEVASSEPQTRFEIEYSSSLAPAPGLPGVLR
ncbi:hypothetical protein [Pseudomarimonas salicorniae]|uniref:DUF4426 domain-containing protein n=1 Tax=Pseudomarimonas salicorniae TaxID=2933270 RepID=A0ABT0GGM2_9GAMM|nr:hypothetical protein [Lysobacter sp. CAU 1642]MCK7593688.1 hypothetical protein [Lysobacter sp. CAU 1642]